MTKNTEEHLNLKKIEELLSTSSTSSIYSTLSKIQQGKVIDEENDEQRLGIDLNGFSKHTSLPSAPLQETISESISLPSSEVQEKAVTQYQVSIFSLDSSIKSLEKTLLSVGGRQLEYLLKTVMTSKHSEEVKTEISGSTAGIIILPPFTDTNDIHTIINKHVSELWSYNGRGPVPFVIVVLEDNITAGTVPEDEVNQSVQTFIDHLNPITRGNYGFGIKCHFIKSIEVEKELKTILRSLAILLISYERFKKTKS
ncbi:MAG: hypothetical protein JSV04_11165 [Candidatus Heimdallarchaeota archaeon]|nr:MAG: hypothetical protein JSV04_11165 [Candidatus Heimdallarchaeota archaeon]